MTTTTEGLTRDQLRAMRNADSVALRWHVIEGGTEGELDLQREVKRTDGFGDETLHVKVSARARVANYGGHHYGEEAHALDPAVSGTWVLLSIKHNAVWQTIAGFVKPGDTLEQEWVVDNRNDLQRDAHLTHHEVLVRVTRPSKSGNPKLYTFMLDAAVQIPGGIAENVRRECRS